MKRTDVMSVEEVQQVLAYLRARETRPNAWLTLAIMRLALCGLRSCELCGLRMRDVILDGPYPALTVPKGITKGRESQRRAREVPLWWDEQAVDDLRPWHEHRLLRNACANDPLLTVLQPEGAPMTWASASKRWKRITAQVLGQARAKQLHIHSGRHTFISHALAIGRNPVEVMEAAGHASLEVTTEYAHRVASNRLLPSLYSSSSVGCASR